jgi:hypothetical protein
MNDIPNITDNVSFATHLAVGLVDAEIWESTRMNIWEKLQQGKYWEHLGAGVSGTTSKMSLSGKSESCGHWSKDDIKSIRAIEILGRVKISDNEVSNNGKVDRSRCWTLESLSIAKAL